jgi:hypothetical protein
MTASEGNRQRVLAFIVVEDRLLVHIEQYLSLGIEPFAHLYIR